MPGPTDDVTPEMPEDEGITEPELRTEEIEGARLLANEARVRLRADGFDDDEVDAWTRAYYVANADEGDVDGLVAWIAEEQAAGRTPG